MDAEKLMNQHEYRIMFDAEENHWWYRGLREVLLNWIKKLSPKKVLDAGCGTGMNAFEVNKLSIDIIAIDLSKEAIELTKSRGIKNSEVGDVTNLSFKNESFDCIFCMDVLSMLEEDDLKKALSEFNRCLTKDGYLLLNDTAFKWLYSAHDYSIGVRHRFTKSEVKNLLEEAGFKVEFQTYRVFILFPIIATFKLIRKLELKFRKERKNVTGDVARTNKLINKLLFIIMKLESFIIQKWPLPFGTSIFTVAKK